MNPVSSSGFGKVRQPAVAGRFYPANPLELRRLIESLMASTPSAEGPSPKAIIAPHAGYVYSGPIAASAYAQLVPESEVISRIILFGPAHFEAFDGIAVSSAEAFATPLGTVPVDQAGITAARELGEVVQLDKAHEREHSLEVQLPFLQVTLPEFSVVPLVVGRSTPAAVSRAMEALWGGLETRFVISSDLSHYLDWADADRLDRSTAKAIEELNSEGILEHQACGRTSILGLIETARRRRLVPHTVDLRNSGDTSGPRERVVGYGAFAFHEPRMD